MKTFTKQITVILLVFIAIVACNKEEAVAETPVAETPVAENPTPENPLSENSVTGAVRLPAGSTIDSNGLTPSICGGYSFRFRWFLYHGYRGG